MDVFSADYFSARAAFRAAAANNGAQLSALPLSASGPHGEELSIDIAWLGAREAQKVLLHSSGLHGVEGFAGAAIQLQLLRRLPTIPAGCALLLVHILNPFGMSWLRRVNENNVDLNRNFLFAGVPQPPVSAAYARLDALLNPPYPARADGFFLRVLYNLLRYGYAPLKAALACGQYAYPRGLFYGGQQLEEGLRGYQDWLKAELPAPRRLLVIDLHTGLGACGQESLLQALTATPPDELSRWLKATVSDDSPQNKVLGYRTSGSHEQLYAQLYPQSQIDFITHEFGTRPSLQVLRALRAENQWHHFGGGGLMHSAKRQLKDAFWLTDQRWQQRILERGCALVANGLRMLAAKSA